MPTKKTRRSTATGTAVTSDSPCPCGLTKTYGDCCGSLHRGQTTAATAEQLMRSRFSAFAVGDTAYLLRSWHSTTRPARLDLDPQLRWVRLEILGTTQGSAFHTEGTVEFRAHCTVHGQPDSQYENSRFVREGGQWVYLDAIEPAADPTGH